MWVRLSLETFKYHQEVWKNLSEEILWKFLTAGHLVYLGPCPATGHLATAFWKSPEETVTDSMSQAMVSLSRAWSKC